MKIPIKFKIIHLTYIGLLINVYSQNKTIQSSEQNNEKDKKSIVKAVKGKSFMREQKYHQIFYINNSLAEYSLGIRETASPPETYIGMPHAPHHHNFLPWDFIQIQINGIKLKKLIPKSILMQKYEAKTGWLIKFNFNGVFLDLFFFMRPDSPILWCQGTITLLKGVSLNSLEVSIFCYPSLIISKNYAKSDVYDRTVFTPERKIPLTPFPKNFPLLRSDKIVIFSDKKHPPPEGFGPCAVILDWDALSGASVNAGSQYYKSKTILKMQTERRSFLFGIFSSNKKYTNQKLLEFINHNKSGFLPLNLNKVK